MNVPPGPPPANPKKKTADTPGAPAQTDAGADWDDALGDRKVQTVSPDMVRRLLEMNPALRAQGLNTNYAVAQAHKAQNQAAQGHKAPAAGQSQTSNDDIFTAFASIKGELATQQKAFDTEIERLTREKKNALTATLDRVQRWLQANDPDMRSPVTQQVLEQDKNFLDAIGFTVKDYVATRLKKK